MSLQRLLPFVCIIVLSPSLLGCFQLLYKHAGNKTKPLLISNPTLATTPFLYFSFFLELPSISLLVPLDPKTDLAKDVMVEIGQMVTKLFPLPGHTNKWCFPVSLHLNETMWLVLAIGMWVRVMCQLQAEAFEYGSTSIWLSLPFPRWPWRQHTQDGKSLTTLITAWKVIY